jgi:FkbM family methyltransferase
MPLLKDALKAVISLTPYRIVRAQRPVPRYQAIPETLKLLKSFGYEPKVVIDGGANVGLFAKTAAQIFPDADIHMIEPQPGCHPVLRTLEGGRFELHPVALVSPEAAIDGYVTMESAEARSTGAHVSTLGRTRVAAATLDQRLADRVGPDDRALLKMDLQGHELEALRGAEKLLPAIEVILCEVTFIEFDQTPRIAALMRFLDERGFGFFDIAALAGRGRDNRLAQGDFIFVNRRSPIAADKSW